MILKHKNAHFIDDIYPPESMQISEFSNLTNTDHRSSSSMENSIILVSYNVRQTAIARNP